MEYKPHNYQVYCIDRVVNDPAVGLFLQPGLGKTSITLSAINILRYYRWSVSKVLVIAPKKVAEATWSKEAAKWNHLQHLRIVTVLGTPATKRIRALNTPGDIYVINRENVAWLVDYYKQAWPFDMVVLDESTSFKSQTAKRFKALKLVRRFIKRIVLLTGTPAPKGLEDLWAQVFLLDGGARLGRTLGQYRQIYFNAKQNYRRDTGKTYNTYTPRPSSLDYVLKAIGDICISMKAEDYLELPDRIDHEIPVVLDSKTMKAYKKFEREMLLNVDDDTIAVTSAAAMTNKLLQFCAGAMYDADGNVVHIHDCKLDAYIELLEQLNGAPCLTLYGYKHDRDRILERLSRTDLRVRVYSGPEDEDAWNAGEVDVLLAHPASCALGLNLQAGGQHIVWYTPNWSFELNDQGVRRLWRQGSPYDKIIVHYLVVQGGVDEDVIDVVKSRESTHETVMRVLKARIQKVKEVS